MTVIEKYLSEKLQNREDAGNLRRLSTSRAPVDFFSNDYLGFITDGIIAEKLSGYSVSQLKPGSTGSRLLSGNSLLVEALEKEIAEFHNADAALIFNSGYDANTGLINGIANRHTTIVYDDLCHASIIDGIRLSHAANKYRFAHNNIADLEQKLAKAQGPLVVVVEAIYSMDGDMAPLKDITEIAERYKATLIVDEAHATGIFGEDGRGLVCMMGLEEKVFARVHTFGKALGCHGAAVLGSELLKQYLINFARSFIYTTALPLHSVYAIQAAYNHMASPGFSNHKLKELISFFREKIRSSADSRWKGSISPIQAIIVGSNCDAKQLAAALQNAGLQVSPILHPTVPLGAERLRICLHSFNTKGEIDLLFKTIKENPCSAE